MKRWPSSSKVGETTVQRWKRLRRETGSRLPPLPKGGGKPPRVAPDQYDLVREIDRAEPDLTIAEESWEIHRRTKRSLSPASMGRTLRRLGITQERTMIATSGQSRDNSNRPGIDVWRR